MFDTAPSLVAASSQRHSVAVMLPMVTDPLFSDTFQAINERLTKAGYQVLLGVSRYKTTQEQALREVILSRCPDGIACRRDLGLEQ